jgi:hypothetical protein
MYPVVMCAILISKYRNTRTRVHQTHTCIHTHIHSHTLTHTNTLMQHNTTENTDTTTYARGALRVPAEALLVVAGPTQTSNMLHGQANCRAWKCARCTYAGNRPAHRSCSMCGKKRCCQRQMPVYWRRGREERAAPSQPPWSTMTRQVHAAIKKGLLIRTPPQTPPRSYPF